jgi:hypothetical protein
MAHKKDKQTIELENTSRHADAPNLGLLRPRHDRPCRRRAAEKGDELAPFHAIKSLTGSSWEGNAPAPAE